MNLQAVGGVGEVGGDEKVIRRSALVEASLIPRPPIRDRCWMVILDNRVVEVRL
jgi:hypothetical protein